MFTRADVDTENRHLLRYADEPKPYTRHRRKFDKFFQVCTGAYEAAFRAEDRESIRATVLWWIRHIMYKENTGVFVDLPYPAPHFLGREVPLAAVFQRQRKQWRLDASLTSHNWRDAFEEYWKDFARPRLRKLRNVYPRCETKPLRLGVSRFHDTGLIGAFWDGATDLISKDLAIEIECAVVGWERFDDEFKARRVDVGLSSFPPIFKVYQEQPAEPLQFAYGLYEYTGHGVFASTTFVARVLDEAKRRRRRKAVLHDLESLVDNPKHSLTDEGLQVLLTTFAGERANMRIACELDTDHEVILRSFLAAKGARFKRHYDFYSSQDSDQSMASFLAGESDLFLGGLKHAYYVMNGEEKHKARALVRPGEMGCYVGAFPVNGFVVSKPFLAKRPQALGRLVWLWFVLMEILEASRRELRSSEPDRSRAILLRLLQFMAGDRGDLLVSDPSELATMYGRKYDRFYLSPRVSQTRMLAKEPQWLPYWHAVSAMSAYSRKPGIEEVIPAEEIRSLTRDMLAVL